MKVVVSILLLALCCSLGTGNPLDRNRRNVQTVRFQYYQKGGSTTSGQSQFSVGEAEMFCFIFQGVLCMYNAVRNGPQDKKEAAYRMWGTNTIRFVETYANSCRVSPRELFSTQEEYNFYLQLLEIDQNGDYGNIGHVESTCDGLLTNLGKSLSGLLQGLGMTVGNALNAVTGLVGGIGGGLLGGVINAAGSLVGGVVNTAGNLVGGVLNTAGNLVGGVTGGILGGGKGGGGLLGGLTGGILGGGKGGGGLLGGGGGGLLGGGGGGLLGLGR